MILGYSKFAFLFRASGQWLDQILSSYPPTNGKIDDVSEPNNTTILPSPKLAQSGLWEQDRRDKCRNPTFKKADLDRRRSTVRITF